MKNNTRVQRCVMRMSWTALTAATMLQFGGCSLFRLETLTNITVNALLSPVSDIIFDALTSLGGAGA